MVRPVAEAARSSTVRADGTAVARQGSGVAATSANEREEHWRNPFGLKNARNVATSGRFRSVSYQILTLIAG